MPETASIEALKVGYQQTKDGMKLTLVIHPDDMPDFLALAPIGQRIAFAAVLIEDETGEHGQGEKVRQPKTWHDYPLSSQAAMRCTDLNFAHWLEQSHPHLWFETAASMGTAADTLGICTHTVRRYCGVKSRSEIMPDSAAGIAWLKLDQRYRQETGRMAEQRDGAA